MPDSEQPVKNAKVTQPAFEAQKGKGRPKGAVNKNTKALKDMILGALDGAGGEAYLKRQAEENPGPFLTLVGKVLPLQLTGDANAPIVLQLTSTDERL
jgi:hypothetical protein